MVLRLVLARVVPVPERVVLAQVALVVRVRVRVRVVQVRVVLAQVAPDAVRALLALALVVLARVVLALGVLDRVVPGQGRPRPPVPRKCGMSSADRRSRSP